MRKNIILTLFALTYSLIAKAQDISGIVIDIEKYPIMAANVYFISEPNSGVVCDMSGRFSIPFSNDRDSLVVSFIGYDDRTIPANQLSKNSNNTITLERKALSVDEVIVFGATPVSEQFSTKKLSSLDIYMNPISQADPLKAIINMPASTNSDETANPSLRGSSSDRSRVIYNGVPIYRPVRASSLNNVGFFSIFNPEMIDIQTVYPSNPPLTTGNASGGMVDINTIRRIDKNKYQASVGIGNIGVALSQKLKGNSTFVQAYGNWQNSTLLKDINDKSLPDMKSYDTKDAGVNIRLKLSDKVYFNTFNYYMNENYKGVSSMLAYQGDLESNSMRYFSVNNLSIFSSVGVFTVNYGYNHEKRDVIFGNNKMHSKDYSHYASLNYKNEIARNLTFQAGVTLDNQNMDADNTMPLYYYAMNEDSPTFKQDTTISNYILEPYVYLNWDINKKISMSLGARTNIPINNQKQYVSGQYSIRYNPVNNHSLILSAGQYHNYTQPDYYNLMYRLLNSRQISLDYSYEKDQTKIQSAVYFKRESGEQPVELYYAINKTQTLGFEVSISQTFWKYLTIFLSNTTIKQDVYIDDVKYKGGHHFAYFVKPSITYTNPKILSVGLSYIARPGSYILDYPVSSSVWNPDVNAYEPIYGPLEELQRGSYNRLDLSISKHMTFDKFALTIYLSINNILNTKNETNSIYYNADYSETYSKYHTLRTFYTGLVFSF